MHPVSAVRIRTLAKRKQQEAIERTIDLPEPLPVVEAMLRFLYTGACPPQGNDEDAVIMLGTLFGMACKYDIKSLEEYTSNEFAEKKAIVNNMAVVGALREAYTLAELPQHARFLDALFSRNLRNISHSDSEELKELLHDNPNFAATFSVKLLDAFNFERFKKDQFSPFLNAVLGKSGREWVCTHDKKKCFCGESSKICVKTSGDYPTLIHLEGRCRADVCNYSCNIAFSNTSSY